MAFKVTEPVIALREKPDDTAPHPAGTLINGDIVERLADADVAGWIEVKVKGSDPAIKGFIHTSAVTELVAETAIDMDQFIATVSLDARATASNAIFLYALAFAESGITNT